MKIAAFHNYSMINVSKVMVYSSVELVSILFVPYGNSQIKIVGFTFIVWCQNTTRYEVVMY